MHDRFRVAWLQFETMMRTGVPHAMDIASELAQSSLEIPLPSHVPKPVIDLEYYCVVHRAYRAGVLPTFLAAMQDLKQTGFWNRVQNCQSTQMWILQFCLESGKRSQLERLESIQARLSEEADSKKDVA